MNQEAIWNDGLLYLGCARDKTSYGYFIPNSNLFLSELNKLERNWSELGLGYWLRSEKMKKRTKKGLDTII